MSFSSAPARISVSIAPSINLLLIKSLKRLATIPNFIPLATIFPSTIFGMINYLLKYYILFTRKKVYIFYVHYMFKRCPIFFCLVFMYFMLFSLGQISIGTRLV